MSFAEASLGTVISVLARLCEQYPIIFPNTKAIADADPNVNILIEAYKQVTHRPKVG